MQNILARFESLGAPQQILVAIVLAGILMFLAARVVDKFGREGGRDLFIWIIVVLIVLGFIYFAIVVARSGARIIPL